MQLVFLKMLLLTVKVVEMMGEMASQLKALILGTIEVIDMNADYAAHHRMAEYGGFKL